MILIPIFIAGFLFPWTLVIGVGLWFIWSLWLYIAHPERRSRR